MSHPFDPLTLNGIARVLLHAQPRDVAISDAEIRFPHECCGLLCGIVEGQAAVITRAVPAQNQETLRGNDRFRIDPREYERAEQMLRKEARGEGIAGIYHSHPSGSTAPSRVDLEAASGLFQFARVRYIYLIFSIGSCAGCATVQGYDAWRLNATGDNFEEATLLRP